MNEVIVMAMQQRDKVIEEIRRIEGWGINLTPSPQSSQSLLRRRVWI